MTDENHNKVTILSYIRKGFGLPQRIGDVDITPESIFGDVENQETFFRGLNALRDEEVRESFQSRKWENLPDEWPQESAREFVILFNETMRKLDMGDCLASSTDLLDTRNHIALLFYKIGLFLDEEFGLMEKYKGLEQLDKFTAEAFLYIDTMPKSGGWRNTALGIIDEILADTEGKLDYSARFNGKTLIELAADKGLYELAGAMREHKESNMPEGRIRFSKKQQKEILQSLFNEGDVPEIVDGSSMPEDYLFRFPGEKEDFAKAFEYLGDSDIEDAVFNMEWYSLPPEWSADDALGFLVLFDNIMDRIGLGMCLEDPNVLNNLDKNKIALLFAKIDMFLMEEFDEILSLKELHQYNSYTSTCFLHLFNYRQAGDQRSEIEDAMKEHVEEHGDKLDYEARFLGMSLIEAATAAELHDVVRAMERCKEFQSAKPGKKIKDGPMNLAEEMEKLGRDMKRGLGLWEEF